jgi:hypothetical protein
VRVEHCLTITRKWRVFQQSAAQLLLRSVVEGCRDCAFALEDLTVGSHIVDELHGIASLDLLFH